MKAADLEAARRLAGELASVRALGERLEAGEPLTLLLGEGRAASAIVLAPDYLAGLRRDVAGGLSARAEALAAALAGLGVEA